VSSLTPCRRVIQKQLMVSQLLKKFHTFYRNRRFITVYTRACHLFVSIATYIHPIYFVRSTLILFYQLHFGLPSGLLTGGSPKKFVIHLDFFTLILSGSRSRWPRRLSRGSAAARLLGLRVRIPPGACMSLSCEWCIFSGRDLCVGLITRP
jgi:hypothetical protein